MIKVALEDSVKAITTGNMVITQSYAIAVDTGYDNSDTSAWSKLLYQPSPVMPEKKVSKSIYWWMLRDMYEASMEQLVIDTEKIKIQRCTYECGYLFIDYDSHMWDHHQELINLRSSADNYMADLSAEVQKDMTKGQGSNLQVAPLPEMPAEHTAVSEGKLGRDPPLESNIRNSTIANTDLSKGLEIGDDIGDETTSSPAGATADNLCNGV